MFGAQLARRIAAGGRFAWLGTWLGTRLGTHIDRATERWLGGPRLLWWPRGIAAGPRRAIVSSRLPRALDQLPALFAHLNASLAELRQTGDCAVVVVPSTAAAEAIDRGARRAGVPRILVSLPDPKATIDSWLADCAKDPVQFASDFPVAVSPPIEASADGPEPPWPLADRVLLALADEVDAVSVRPGGVWQRLLVHRLRSEPPASINNNRCAASLIGSERMATHRPSPIRVAADPTVTPPKLLDELVEFGAEAWRVPVGLAADVTLIGSELAAARGADDDLVDDLVDASTGHSALAALGPYLIHATRRCDGPWPGQETDAYWDELLDGSPAADRSPLATLAHLLEEGRIRGSGRAIRGGFEVVCWAEFDVAEWSRHRVWRKHRRRWDFEPYGVAVARDWLERQGARRVFYGDERDWAKLSAAERPYFQRARSERAASERATAASLDWQTEREWRTVGDFDLGAIPAGKMVILAGDIQAANWLRQRFARPVAVIDESSRASR